MRLHLAEREVEQDGLLHPRVRGPLFALAGGGSRDAERAAIERADRVLHRERVRGVGEERAVGGDRFDDGAEALFELAHQYLGTLGLTFSDQASMPPSTFHTFRNPALRKCSAAARLRTP